jgi:hypothetical protein
VNRVRQQTKRKTSTKILDDEPGFRPSPSYHLHCLIKRCTNVLQTEHILIYKLLAKNANLLFFCFAHRLVNTKCHMKNYCIFCWLLYYTCCCCFCVDSFCGIFRLPSSENLQGFLKEIFFINLHIPHKLLFTKRYFSVKQEKREEAEKVILIVFFFKQFPYKRISCASFQKTTAKTLKTTLYDDDDDDDY